MSYQVSPTTLEIFGYKPEDAWVVGDTWYDIEMGRRAGVRTCGVTYGNGSREELIRAGADVLIDDFGELLNRIKKGNDIPVNTKCHYSGKPSSTRQTTIGRKNLGNIHFMIPRFFTSSEK